jgi:hypothetical protein
MQLRWQHQASDVQFQNRTKIELGGHFTISRHLCPYRQNTILIYFRK